MYGQATQTQKSVPRVQRFLPKELLAKCIMLVERTHKVEGFANLPARICTRENMVALALVDDRGSVALKSATLGWKLRLALWVSSLVIFVLAWFFTWWILLGLIAVVVFDQICARLNKRYWMFASAMLLSLEVLVQDLAGWGTAYPEERERAVQLLGQQTDWLDFYLPNRANIDSITLKKFGPCT